MDRNISVKVSGVHNLTSARYFAARNADYLGFCIDPEHPVYCSPEKIAEIISWVEGPAFVLESQGMSEEWFKVAEKTGLQHMHIKDVSSDINHQSGQKVFADMELDQVLNESVPDYITPVIQYSGKPADVSAQYLNLLIQTCQARDCYLDFIWTSPDETIDFLAKTGCAGVIIHAGDDIQTGLQDFDWMDDFFDLLEK